MFYADSVFTTNFEFDNIQNHRIAYLIYTVRDGLKMQYLLYTEINRKSCITDDPPTTTIPRPDRSFCNVQFGNDSCLHCSKFIGDM